MDNDMQSVYSDKDDDTRNKDSYNDEHIDENNNSNSDDDQDKMGNDYCGQFTLMLH